jgi:arylsulfatase A-like enzyme
MASFRRQLLTSFRISGAMFCAFCATEAILFRLTSVYCGPTQLLLATGLGLGAALLLALALAAASALVPSLGPHVPRLSSFLGSLLLVYILLVLWLQKDAFKGHPWWMYLLGFTALLGLVALVGRFVYSYLTRLESAMAEAWFQALAPLAAVSAGLYSAANHRIEDHGRYALAVLGILVLLVVGQYLAVRFLWSRRRERLTRLAVRLHLLVIVGVTGAALLLAGISRLRERRPATAAADAPPVVLISIDTLRQDRLSCYNSATAPTPAMDSLARDGIRFGHAVSPSSWTPSAMGAIFTGIYPSACNAGTLVTAGTLYNYSGPLRAAKKINEAFLEAGYTTAAFVANPWMMPSQGYTGFDIFELHHDPKYWPRFRFVMFLDFIAAPFRPRLGGPADRLNGQVFSWLDHRPAGPFFLWVHYIDPHLPYLAHPKYPVTTKGSPVSGELSKDEQSWRVRAESFNLSDLDKQYLREAYLGEVRYTDDGVASLLAKLKALGLYDPSLVMLVADHGEELWEHGGFEHGHAFYQEIIAVPLIVKLPHGRNAGAVADQYINTVRVGATLLDAARLDSSFPGRSLLPCLTDPLCGDTGPEGRVSLSERTHYGRDRGALITIDGLKAYHHANDTITCFDLQADPAEREPRPESDCRWPQELDPPRQLFADFARRNHELFVSLGGDKEPFSPASLEEMRRLRALGYIR